MSELFLEYWKLIAFAANGIIVFVFWAMSKTFAKKEDLENLKTLKKDEIEALDKRVSNIEITLEYLPDKDEFHRLDNNLIDVSGKLDAIKPQLDGLKQITGLLMENELKGKS